MTKQRTTVELDEDLLARAKAALGLTTTRGTIEEALRRAAEDVESDIGRRASLQRAFLDRLRSAVDLEVLRSEDMWR
ncbi:MAG: type II toxin-antitoxin system VapB family antitoxin [Actinomycetota bacterium]